MFNVEVCVGSDDFDTLSQSVGAAYSGGAATIELCSAMHKEGLTPQQDRIIEARKAFNDRPGLMVMIRPRQGGFCYSDDEVETMLQQIEMAASVGADGVVFGVLRDDENAIDPDHLRALVTASRGLHLKTTFHRAFDAIIDTEAALDTLISAGVDRVLTNGTHWGSGRSASDGVNKLGEIIHKANDKINIVIGGGVTLANARGIANQLKNNGAFGVALHGTVSFHAYRTVLIDDIVDAGLVSSLLRSINQ